MNSHMGTSLWQQKMNTWFHILDADGNGVITKEDQVLIAKKFQVNGKLQNEQAEQLEKHLAEWWNEVMRDVKGYGCEDFIKSYYSVVENTESHESSKNRLKSMLSSMFKAVDTDSNGTISPKEYFYFINCLNEGMGQRAHEAFALIDLNKDGELSLEEFVQAGLDFFFNENDSVFKNFFGPLD